MGGLSAGAAHPVCLLHGATREEAHSGRLSLVRAEFPERNLLDQRVSGLLFVGRMGSEGFPFSVSPPSLQTRHALSGEGTQRKLLFFLSMNSTLDIFTFSKGPKGKVCKP